MQVLEHSRVIAETTSGMKLTVVAVAKRNAFRLRFLKKQLNYPSSVSPRLILGHLSTTGTCSTQMVRLIYQYCMRMDGVPLEGGCVAP